MPDFKSVIQKNTLETQKPYHNRKIHIEKQMEEISKQYKGDIRRFK